MSYSMSMENEKRPNVKKLLEEGWRKFRINTVEPKISKSGNEMFVINITDDKTSYSEDIYLISKEGKRWLLKELLSACGITKDEQGIYNWKESDLIGKEIFGLVEHEPQEYINRNGETVKTIQHRINKFDTVENQIEWNN